MTNVYEALCNDHPEASLYYPDHLHGAILNLGLDTQVGQDCLQVMKAAEGLIALLTDETAMHEDIRCAVASQCGTFYFG